MKKSLLAFLFVLVCQTALLAQDGEKGFQKDRLFTGGSISLSFFNNAFLVGGNPVFGYSVARWADVGIVGNYSYTSYRDYDIPDDRLKQTVYGGGVFTRLFPVRFLFAQAQFEHNWIQSKYIEPSYIGGEYKNRVSSNSLLLGAGYTTGRDPGGRSAYGYLAVLFDVLQNDNSPYVTYNGNQKYAIPIFRAGFNIPLFTGRR